MSQTTEQAGKPIQNSDRVVNYMNGVSFKISPLATLRMVSASCIRGEPQYYRDGDKKQTKEFGQQRTRATHAYHKKVIISPENYLVFPDFQNKKASEVFDKIINDSLDYNYEKTLEVIRDCRQKYMMRTNPQIMIVNACLHKNRKEFNEKNPGVLKSVMKDIVQRPDDIKQQFDCYKNIRGKELNLPMNHIQSRSKLPTIMKKAWAEWLEEKLTKYQAKKYLNSGYIVDMIRISHPRGDKNEVINEIVKTGNIRVKDTEKTWETLKSQGNTWTQILNQIKMPHMALLRNLRGISQEIKDVDIIQKLINQLYDGVPYGKQFPFRYYTAYCEFDNNLETGAQIIKEGLEKCLEKSMENFPRLEGDTISLCDNSGSAWGTFNSTYGSVTVATIGNLSGLMTAYNCTGNGYVGVFGDKLKIYNVSEDKPLLKQLVEINALGRTVGGGTENGIWLYFDQSIKEKKKYDNIFIYSDMQAGHGGLFGRDIQQYKKYAKNLQFIDVLMLVEDYRKIVNETVNVFSVQVAGYDNNALPENIYRGAIMAGWTGAEVSYAHELINIWNGIEKEVEELVIQI
jgi:60 kDa SS-A/Ro ribonucleoprotein